MKTPLFVYGAAIFALTASAPAFAGQCHDPWVTRAVQQVTGHVPYGNYNSGDCYIGNYGGGHWSSYQDLVNKVAVHFGVCSDPWVTKAIRQVTGRNPGGSGNSGACNIYRYGGGHWSSYPDLVQKVQVAFGRVPRSISRSSSTSVWQIRKGVSGSQYNANGGGMKVSPGVNGAGVVSSGGGNVIAPGGHYENGASGQ